MIILSEVSIFLRYPGAARQLNDLSAVLVAVSTGKPRAKLALFKLLKPGIEYRLRRDGEPHVQLVTQTILEKLVRAIEGGQLRSSEALRAWVVSEMEIVSHSQKGEQQPERSTIHFASELLREMGATDLRIASEYFLRGRSVAEIASALDLPVRVIKLSLRDIRDRFENISCRKPPRTHVDEQCHAAIFKVG